MAVQCNATIPIDFTSQIVLRCSCIMYSCPSAIQRKLRLRNRRWQRNAIPPSPQIVLCMLLHKVVLTNCNTTIPIDFTSQIVLCSCILYSCPSAIQCKLMLRNRRWQCNAIQPSPQSVLCMLLHKVVLTKYTLQ